MWSANLLRRHLSSFNHFGHHRIFHLQSQSQSQWLTRTAVRCFSHNTSSNASGLPVRYISKRRQQHVDNQQSTSSVTHISLHEGIPEGIKLNQEQIKVRKQVVDSGQEIAHIEGIKLNQEFSSDGLVHEECMQATEEVFHVDKKQSTSSLTDIPLLDPVPSTSDSTVFRPNSFQGLPVDRTEGKMPNTEGPILNHSDGHGKDFTDKEQIKVRKQVVDCMTTGQEIAHTPLTYKSGGLPEGIKLNQELSCDGLVDEECMEATDEVFEDVQSNDTYFKAKPDKTRKGAEKLAVDLLAKRAVTAVELRKKLVAKLFPLNIVEAVLRDFQGRGLINDGLYAETFSHSRWKSSSWGPRRIKQALSQKGVTKHDVEKAVKLVFEDSEEVEQGSSVRLSSSSLDQLYIQASKQWKRSHDAHPEKRKARVIRWLQYRGFDWGVIGTIIKKLESKHPRATLP